MITSLDAKSEYTFSEIAKIAAVSLGVVRNDFYANRLFKAVKKIKRRQVQRSATSAWGAKVAEYFVPEQDANHYLQILKSRHERRQKSI